MVPESQGQDETTGQPNDTRVWRRSGIEVIGDVPWGTHFCQFYEISQDLIDILVPYFREGLKSNEFCMWVTAEPFQVEQAATALRTAVPDLDDRIGKGQIEILDYSQWYTKSGKIRTAEVLQGWVDKLTAAQNRGYEGLRLSGDTFGLEPGHSENFTRYEESINNVMGQYNMLAICTYSLRKCGASEIMDVVSNHQFALIKRTGHWEIIQSFFHKKMDRTLHEGEQRFRSLFNSMKEGFALHEIITDKSGKPSDYRFMDVNPAFERLTGLKRDALIGRTVLEVLPGIERVWLETYGRVVLTGEPVHLEEYSEELGRYYDVYAYSPVKGQFATIFTDVTRRRQTEQALRESQVDLNHAQAVAHIGSWRSDIQRNELLWSDETHQIFGIPKPGLFTNSMISSVAQPRSVA